jgi:hypothetical protein
MVGVEKAGGLAVGELKMPVGVGAGAKEEQLSLGLERQRE